MIRRGFFTHRGQRRVDQPGQGLHRFTQAVPKLACHRLGRRVEMDPIARQSSQQVLQHFRRVEKKFAILRLPWPYQVSVSTSPQMDLQMPVDTAGCRIFAGPVSQAGDIKRQGNGAMDEDLIAGREVAGRPNLVQSFAAALLQLRVAPLDNAAAGSGIASVWQTRTSRRPARRRPACAAYDGP